MFSLLCLLVYSFGCFEGGNLILIAPVPGHCLSFNTTLDVSSLKKSNDLKMHAFDRILVHSMTHILC